jgi:hypothetical protein
MARATNVDFTATEIPAPPLPEPTVDNDGYLEDEWLETLRRRPFSAKEAAQFLVETFPKAVRLMWCPSVEVTEESDGIQDCWKIRFATGGWSGAEELIDAVLAHFWMRHHHTVWKRGGLYIFEVPKAFLGPPPSAI